MDVMKQILTHCEQFLACEASLYQSEESDTLIAVFPPTRRRGWWTYVTLELHRIVRSECVMYSYKWEPKVVTHLSYVAEQVNQRRWENGERVVCGDTFSLRGPIVDGSHLNHVLATPPYFEVEGFEYYTNGQEVVRMIMLHPITAAEVDYLSTNGLSALEGLFTEMETDSLDFYRNPGIQRNDRA